VQQVGDKYCVCNFILYFLLLSIYFYLIWLQWPPGLRHRSTAVRLLGLWVRIPPGAWMSVCVECCQVEVSVTGCSLIQRSPTDCDASLCVIYKPQEWGGHGPRWAAAPEEKIIITFKIMLIDILCVGFHTTNMQTKFCKAWKHRIKCSAGLP